MGLHVVRVENISDLVVDLWVVMVSNTEHSLGFELLRNEVLKGLVQLRRIRDEDVHFVQHFSDRFAGKKVRHVFGGPLTVISGTSP